MRNILLIGLFVPVLLISCEGTNSEKIGVVDLPVIYADFDYQKELMAEYSVIESSIQTEIDSLSKSIETYEFSLQLSTEHTDAEKNILFDRAYSDFIYHRDQLVYRNDSIASDYTAKIWKQLNTYISDYGEENDFDVILGMQGNGSVMYVKDETNISEDVLTYVNQKYNGE